MIMSKRENQSHYSGSVEETVLLGRQLAGLLRNKDVLSVTGPLGAGKTCLIRGIAAGLGIPEDDVRSPSFTLLNEYYGPQALYHFDLYRMKDSSELYQIGWDEYLMRDGIVVVEWGEKAKDFLPRNRIDVEIEIVSDSGRKLTVSFIDVPEKAAL